MTGTTSGLERDQRFYIAKSYGLLAALGYGAMLPYQAAGELKGAATAIEEALISRSIEPYK